jgi:thioredoxin-like negative regulator of GroEL
VRGHLGDIPDAAPEAETAQAVLAAAALIDACAAIGGPEVARERLLASEDDLDAHLALGACLAGRGKYRDSLEHLLQVVMRDRKHRDGAAHKAMLTVFTLAGRFSDVSDEYKRRLQIYL